MVELLSILASVTKELRKRRSSESVQRLADVLLTQCDAVKFVKKVFGEKDTQAVLQRLDRLAQDEARTTTAQTLGVAHRLVDNMREFMDGEQT
jgi:RNase P protein component